MADPKGSDGKPNETRSAAVKPPVLDLKAKPGEAPPKPESGPAAKSDSPPKPESKPETKLPPPRPAADPVKTVRPGFPFLAMLGGGLLGLAAAYGLAWYGLWPTTPVPAPVQDPRLGQFGTAIDELEAVTQTTQSELATLTQRVGAMESAAPGETPAALPNVDLGGIEADIAALAGRVDALAATPAQAGASPADIAALATRLDELAARLGSAEANLRSLDTSMAQTTATLADQPSDIGAVLQLPLILSGLETAFGNGRPYEAELAALRSALPDAAIPTAIANGAATGLPRPDEIGRRFTDILPAMLAGTPPDPNASWQQGALDWFRSAIALRPSGEMEGGSPEALLSRLEAAVARRDFVAARELLAALPQAMRAAAGEVAGMIDLQADAATLLDDLRARALVGGATP